MRRYAALALVLAASIACRDTPDRSTVTRAESPAVAEPEAARAAGQPTADPEGRPAESRGAGWEAAERAPAEVPGTHVVYVPAYSHIYHHVGDAFLLATTLSIRNTDPRESLTVTSVRYYDTAGELVRRHLDTPRTLGPLASIEYVVEEQDVSGGSGANFIVEWRSAGPVSPPVIETVMISTRSGQGISFTSRGVTIERPAPATP